MKTGNRYYYLSVPNESNWTEITIMQSTEYKSGQNWSLCYAVEEFDVFGIRNLMCCIDELKETIKAYYELTDSKGWTPSANDVVYWVYVSTQSDIKSIKVKGEAGSNFYPYNSFKTKKEADGLRMIIRTVFRKYGIITENGN